MQKRGLMGKAQSETVRQTIERAIWRALQTLKPPEKLTVSEWADKNRVLSAEETDKPGQWKTANVPYMKFIMDCFNDEHISEIVWLKCTQIGGTEGLLNIVGYVIDQNPSRIIYVLPDDTFCKDFSELRMQKMLESCPALKGKFNAYESKDTLLKFGGGFVFFASAQSPSKLASWSARYIFLDEIDKFPKRAKKEAGPIKLAEERAKNRFNSKIVKVSTPTFKTGPIYQAYEAADKRYAFYVPCPHCGHYQTLKFKDVRWPKGPDGHPDITLARQAAYYECEKCKRRIDDRHKPAMLRGGKWVSEDRTVSHAKKVAFHINSIYSPWLRFGDVAAEYLSSKNDPVDEQNFYNSWLGEPWEDKAAEMDSQTVLDHRTDLPECVVPEYAQLLTGGVDVQKHGFYWTVRAWGAGVTSQCIAYGTAGTWDEIDEIMNRFWPDTNGELKWQVNLCAIDSGYRTEEVYEFCLEHSDWAVPAKGKFAWKMLARFRKSVIDNTTSKAYGQTIYIVNVDKYKDMIAANLNKPVYTRGSFMVHADTEQDYADQITAEHKITDVKDRHEVQTWVPKTSHAANHYLDCEVYAGLAADLLHVRYLEELKPEETESTAAKSREPEEDEWLKGGFELDGDGTI